MNLPKNYKVPNGVKTYLSAVKSEITDPKNRNKVQNNISKEEINALKDLVRLQRERKIVIKQCDKGAGIFIMDLKIMLNLQMNILMRQWWTKMAAPNITIKK